MSKASQNKEPIDRVFLWSVAILVTVGIIIFISASLGILAKNESKFYNVLFSQLALGLVGGGVALYVTSRVPYLFWRKNAFYIFLTTIVLMVLVFVPGLGFVHGGARRWIALGSVSFQPAEFLKLGFIIYFAAWLSWVRQRVSDFRFGVLPLIIMLAIIAGLLFAQPDTKSFVLMLVAGGAMLFVAGVPWKYILGVAGAGIIVLSILAAATPYIRDRVKTFLDPAHDPTGSSYQLQQALIAVGSGGMFGHGLGQSIQKFEYLPEPQGDSIFAVVGEEFGFVGSSVLIVLFLAFMLRGLRIANRAPDLFGKLLALGIIVLISFQSFLNMASIIGVLPLTGVPLVFVSQGGTSLAISLAAVGIVCNISRYHKKPSVK